MNVKCKHFSSEAYVRLMATECVWGPLAVCAWVCVSMLRCSFGRREIKCIHLHLLAGVSCVTCWNSNAPLPPWDSDHRFNAENWARHTTRFVSLAPSPSPSLCPLSFVSPSLLIPYSARHLSPLSHMYKCLPLLLQSGLVSLWHLTNSITNNTIHPMHFELWCSHQWLLLAEPLSDWHQHTHMHDLHPYKTLFSVSKVEPLWH